ncbi:MAG: hypothetical protein PHU85_10575 [Phycisphaerae bacterium]|nr:hypothetical protein [Phycisphaerae bacterium]
MTRPTNNPNRFDPTAPVGSDEAAGLPDVPAGDVPANDRLTELVSRATQPPAGLKLDWGRLHAALAQESPGTAIRGRSASRRPVARFIFYIGGGLTAVAAAIILTTVFVLHRGGPITPPGSQGPGPGPIAKSDAPKPEPEKQVIVWVGIPQEDAKDLVNDRHDSTRNDLVVVFPRADSRFVPQSPSGKTGGPMVMTDKAPLVGTPYRRGAREADSDTPYPGF